MEPQSPPVVRTVRSPLTGFFFGLLLATATLVGLSGTTVQRALAGFAMLLSAGLLIWSLRRDETRTFVDRQRHLNDLVLSPTLAGRDLQGGDFEGAILRARSFNGSSLRGANLVDADITDGTLRNVDLRDVKATNVAFARADLYLADLSGADLENADLTHANLQGANLQGASLIGADLRDANFEGANICGADLSRALVMRTVLQHATYDATTKLPYDLTSERRRDEGLKASIDTTLRGRESRARRFELAPGFAVAVFAGLVLAAGLAGYAYQSDIASPVEVAWPWQEQSDADRTEVLGAVEERPTAAGRTVVVESNALVTGTFEMADGEVREELLTTPLTIDRDTVASLAQLTLNKVEGQGIGDTMSCTLVEDGRPQKVEITTGQQIVCPLK